MGWHTGASAYSFTLCALLVFAISRQGAQPAAAPDAVALRALADDDGAAAATPSSTSSKAKRDTSYSASQPNLTSVWPMPGRLALGAGTLLVPSNITWAVAADAPRTLTDAIARYRALIFSRGERAGAPPGGATAVTINVSDASDAYPADWALVDESYELHVPAPGDAASSAIALTARTVYGALRALETLAQLVAYEPALDAYAVAVAPVAVADAPRFAHRGLLVDVARHYQPPARLRGVVDAMAAAKLNVLHLHLTDQQAFPVQSAAYPKLWRGAYSWRERYTRDELVALVEYARARGVAVMAELDVPGHSASWCKGAPAGVCMDSCVVDGATKGNKPLAPGNATHAVLARLLDEWTAPDVGVFRYGLVHVGGDEVKYECWDQDNASSAWMAEHGLTALETYEDFCAKVASAVAASGERRPVQWNDVYKNFGKVAANAVVEVWTPASDVAAAIASGYDVIAAPIGAWYLSQTGYSVATFYEYDPCSSLDADACAKVLGVEAALWGEKVDASDLDSTMWPRAAAFAERAWSANGDVVGEVNGTFTNFTEWRLQNFRCELDERGVYSESVKPRFARVAPSHPGSCLRQR